MSQKLKITQSDRITIAKLAEREVSKFDETAIAQIAAELFALIEFSS